MTEYTQLCNIVRKTGGWGGIQQICCRQIITEHAKEADTKLRLGVLGRVRCLILHCRLLVLSPLSVGKHLVEQ